MQCLESQYPLPADDHIAGISQSESLKSSEEQMIATMVLITSSSTIEGGTAALGGGGVTSTGTVRVRGADDAPDPCQRRRIQNNCMTQTLLLAQKTTEYLGPRLDL